MYCSQCQKKIQAQDSFCRYCGFSLNTVPPSNQISNENIVSGNGNVSNNSVVGNNNGSITNHSVTNHNLSNLNDFIPRVHLVETRKTPIKSIWITIVGGIGFLSSILTIIGYFKQYGFMNFSNPIPIYPTLIVIVVLAFSIFLFRWGFDLTQGYKTIVIGKVFQTDAKGYIMYSKIYAKCPVSSCTSIFM